MSTIKANDIQNASGGIPTVKGQRLIPTAWVNFNGTGVVAIRDSENVSSITDVATADYRVNFNVAMSNANYSAAATCIYTGSGTGLNATIGGYTTTSLSIFVAADDSVAATDNPNISVQVMGGQA